MIFLKKEKSVNQQVKRLSEKEGRLTKEEQKERRRLLNLSHGRPFGKVLLSFDRVFQKPNEKKNNKDIYKTRRVVLLDGDGDKVTVVPVYKRSSIVPLSHFGGNRLINLNQTKEVSLRNIYDVENDPKNKLSRSEKKDVKRIYGAIKAKKAEKKSKK